MGDWSTDGFLRSLTLPAGNTDGFLRSLTLPARHIVCWQLLYRH
jgi:hypothetical protein